VQVLVVVRSWERRSGRSGACRMRWERLLKMRMWGVAVRALQWWDRSVWRMKRMVVFGRTACVLEDCGRFVRFVRLVARNATEL
jgi:hypothetical protein